MSKRKDEAYIFACARIRSNENGLLTALQVEKMVTAKDLAEAVSVLAEVGYETQPSGDMAEPAAVGNKVGASAATGGAVAGGASGFAGSGPSVDLDWILGREQARLYELVRSAIPDETELYPLLLPNDYHNLKVILKAEFLGTDPQPLLISTGTMDPDRLATMIRERDFMDLTAHMRKGVESALDLFSKDRDPQKVDFVLDQECYQDVSEQAARLGNDFIAGYVKLLVDCLNVRTFVRLRRMGKDFENFKAVFLQGGNIPETVLVEAYEEPLEHVAEIMMPYGFQEIFKEGGAAIENTGRFTLFEKLCDDLLMDYVKKGKYVTFGIEPIAAYFLAKESELKTVRTLLAGKAAGLPPEQIRERMRQSYV